MSNLISSVAWVRRGVAQQHPTKYVLDDQELQRVSKLARIELEDARKELERAHKAALEMGQGLEVEDEGAGVEEDGDVKEGDGEDEWVDEDDDAMDVDEGAPKKGVEKKNAEDLSEYKLDDYDEEEAEAGGLFSNIKGLTYYKDNEEDPYITLKEDPEEDERAELEVLPTDNLLVAAKTEDEISQLEVYVYDENEENLYVHHDLMLPSFPLCLEWLDYPPVSDSSSRSEGAPTNTNAFGNYIAVGTLDPEIEIWSLDTIDAMYPSTVLGRPDKTKAHVPVALGTGKKKRKKTKARAKDDSCHVDAVLGLSWNRNMRNLLASASADRTVKLWDLSRHPLGAEGTGEGGGAIRSFDVHKDKVQAVQWNTSEPSVLLTGSYDRTVRTFDSRAPTAGVGAVLGSDVESLRWDPWESYGFYVTLENGLVLNFDARTLPSNLENPSPARFTLSAHDGAASSIDVNPHIKGCIVTGGTDKLVKVWNITDDEDNGKRSVSLVTSRDLGVGKVFSTQWSPDDPLTLAAAGSKAKLQLWDLGSNMGTRKVFSSKLKASGKILEEKGAREGHGGVIGVQSDGEESDADEEPLPDESPRGSIANLINRFENQTKRATSQQGTYSVSSRSSSVVSHTSSVGDASTVEVKEKKEWPPKNLGQQATQLPGDKPGFVMPSYLRPSVNVLASTVAGSLSRTSSNGSGGSPGESVAKDASKQETVDTPKAVTPPTNGASTPVQPPPISQSTSDLSLKSDSSSSKGAKPAITPVDTTKAAQKPVEEAAASENADVEPDTPKPGVRRKASTLTVTAASGAIPPASSAKSAVIGKTPTTAKPPGTARHPPATTKPPAKPAAATTAPKTPAKAAPSSFKGSATTATAARPTKTITPQSSIQSLEPQHTGGSVTSNASTQRKPGSKPTPATPSRAKTPSKVSSTASASRAKSPARARTPAKPTPTTGLYAPTAASLAKARNAPPLPAVAPVKKVLSSEVAERLSKPTQASLSKVRPHVTPEKPAGTPRPSFGGGPGTPMKKAISTAGTTPSKPSTSTTLKKAASASPAAPKGAVSPKKGIAGKAGVIAVGAAGVAAASGVASESEVVEAVQPQPEVEPEPEPEAPIEEAVEEPAALASNAEEDVHEEEVVSETEPEPTGEKAGTEIEDMVNLLEFTPIAKIRGAMDAQENATSENGKTVSAEEVQAEIPDENSE